MWACVCVSLSQARVCARAGGVHWNVPVHSLCACMAMWMSFRAPLAHATKPPMHPPTSPLPLSYSPQLAVVLATIRRGPTTQGTQDDNLAPDKALLPPFEAALRRSGADGRRYNATAQGGGRLKGYVGKAVAVGAAFAQGLVKDTWAAFKLAFSGPGDTAQKALRCGV